MAQIIRIRIAMATPCPAWKIHLPHGYPASLYSQKENIPFYPLDVCASQPGMSLIPTDVKTFRMFKEVLHTNICSFLFLIWTS